MDRIPRYTDFFQHIAADILPHIHDMKQDREIHQAYERTFVVFCESLAHHAEGGNDYDVYLRALTTLIRARAPVVAQYFDKRPGSLEHLLWGAFCHRLGVAVPPEAGVRLTRLAPDNPIERLGENIYYIPEDVAHYRDAQHQRECLLQLSGYLTAIRPAKPVGRSKKPQKPIHRAQPPRGHDPEYLARCCLTYELHERGMHWREIARYHSEHGYPMDESERTRKNIYNWTIVGRRQEMRKDKKSWKS